MGIDEVNFEKRRNKRIIMFVVLIVSIVLVLFACTENTRARRWGGNASIELPKGQKLLNVTWKDNNSLWYLVRPFKPGETPETYTFQESSSYGIFEGTVVLVETL